MRRQGSWEEVLDDGMFSEAERLFYEACWALAETRREGGLGARRRARELVNKVVEAERVAKANLIRRQEETAATRSLLNTAKLMEENPLLLRLKELESLERLVEKVGRIDLHAGDGQGLDALLTKLVRLKAPESA